MLTAHHNFHNHAQIPIAVRGFAPDHEKEVQLLLNHVKQVQPAPVTRSIGASRTETVVMATASPTPMGSSHFGLRRPSSRQNFRQPTFRPNLSRNGPIPVTIQSQPAANLRQYSLNDSSDDELPMPMKFSALTKALLNDDASILPPSPAADPSSLSGSTAVKEGARHIRAGSEALAEQRARERTASPDIRENSPFPRRVVRLSGTPGSSTLRRTASLSSAVRRQNEQEAFRPRSPLDLITPAPLPRTVRIPVTSSLSRGAGSSGRLSQRTNSGTRSGDDRDVLEDPATVARTQAAISHGSVSRYGSSTVGRSRYGDDTGMQSSMRPKRIGKVAGSFLSGPARRGRRRQSEDEQEPGQENEDGQDGAFSSQEPQSQEGAFSSQEPRSHELPYRDMQSSQESLDNPGSSIYASQARDFASGSPVASSKAVRAASPHPIFQAAQPPKEVQKSSPAKPQVPVYRLPAPRPDLPSMHDQENEAPPTFKKSKPTSIVLLDKMDKAAVQHVVHDLDSMRANASPEQRKPLGPRSHNTPHRVAPPPPKMSVLEAATATAGAATASHTRSKRQNIRVNGKHFTRLEVVGRGGSSKVWRVMAENNKIFALKRVSLEDADENAVRGYKGEIDLLQKLKGNDRVVTMLDYEMNDEKQTLSVLMEMGELDFNKILEPRLTGEHSAFDPSFTRHYWKEMLECIQAVHDHDIVHSDLKPANFVLVRGQLKLIDFGIANAIETNETVNVHRDTQIGTPNYMSPESLMDANELPGARGRISNQPKVMKLGKPSDIWSLGCILYQVSYGRPPFGHIQNHMSRCRAIIDWSYAIDFPPTGLGGVLLPKSLIRTMKKCLNRNQHERPSAKDLLDPRDPFLSPIECDDGSIPMTEELLGRILQNAASKFKDRTPSDVELLSLWPAGYFASLKKGMN